MAKIHTDKKRYREECRRQVLKGLMNNADGLWVTPPLPGLGGKSVDIFAGYRLGNSKKRKGPKGMKPEVE